VKRRGEKKRNVENGNKRKEERREKRKGAEYKIGNREEWA
jgi:hypothetical protein